MINICVQNTIELSVYLFAHTLQLHYNAVHRKKNALYTRDHCSIIHIRKQMPHPPSFGMGHQSVYLVYSYNTQTFINRGINSVCW